MGGGKDMTSWFLLFYNYNDKINLLLIKSLASDKRKTRELLL